MKRITALLAMCMALFVFSAQAADIVIEGFEDATNVHSWQSVSPAEQSPGAGDPVVQAGINTESTNNVTEGSEALRLTLNWDGSYAGSTPNVVISGGPTLWWGYRINIGNSTPLSFPNGETIRADFFNNSPFANLQVAIYVSDGSTTSYERGPLVTLNANGSTSYEWDTSTGSTSYLTGDGTLNQSTLYLKGLVIYTEVNPSPNLPLLLDADNFRVVDVGDIVPPAVPVIKAVEQGPASGELVVKWAANTEGDLGGYNVYLATDADWQAVLTNRLTIPSIPAASVAAPATQTTLTGVPTDENVYVVITAYDTSNNESPSDLVLGARLRPDGGATNDLVVLDLDRYTAADSTWITNGYFHHVVYYAQALDAVGRYFASCRAGAVDDASVTLPSGADNIVIWTTGLDGNTVPDQTITETSQAALTSLLAGNGNLFLTGMSIGLDLTTNGSVADQAFFSGTLKAGLGSDNAASNEIVTSAPFNVGTIYTGADVFNMASFATLDNEALTPNGSFSAMAYVPAPSSGAPAIYSESKLVYFGFSFDSVRHTNVNPQTGQFGQAATLRANLMDSVVEYLVGAPPLAAQSSWNLYE